MPEPRPLVATMTQIASLCRSFSLLMVEEPIRAIEQPINLARHDEIVLMQSFDLLGAQRDSSMAPVHEETCGNCRCCRNSVAHRLERGDACIWSSTKGRRRAQSIAP